MALVKCPECGRMVSPNAKECPGCGAPNAIILECLNQNGEEKIPYHDPEEDMCNPVDCRDQETLNPINISQPDTFSNDKKELKTTGKKQSSTIIITITIATIIVLSIILTVVILKRKWGNTKHLSNNTIEKTESPRPTNVCSQINCRIYDGTGGYTNVRNAPKGDIIDRIPCDDGSYGVWVDREINGWWHIRDSKVFDINKNSSRSLNGSDCWIHESQFIRQSDWANVKTYGHSDNYTLNTKLLSEDDLRNIPKSDLRIMRNEIYARHGYIFKSKDMQEYFSKKPWYNGYESNTNNIELNDIEQKNIALIKRYE